MLCPLWRHKTEQGYERLLSTGCLERRALSSGLSTFYVVSSGNRAQPRFLRLSEVLEMTGMGKTFIYDRIKDGTFPKQIQLGSRSVVWNEQEVITWMEDQMASR